MKPQPYLSHLLLLALSACVASQPLVPVPPLAPPPVAAGPDSIPGQRITAPAVPLLRQGCWGLVTPAGQVVVPPTYEQPVEPVGYVYSGSGLWRVAVPQPKDTAVDLFGPRGQQLGRYVAAAMLSGYRSLVVAEDHDTSTLFTPAGRIVQRFPYHVTQLHVDDDDGLIHVSSVGFIADAIRGHGPEGALDTLGRVVVPPRYRYAGSRRPHGFVEILSWTGRAGVLDAQGQEHWIPRAFRKGEANFYYPYWHVEDYDRNTTAVVSLTGQVPVPYGRYVTIMPTGYQGTLTVTKQVPAPGLRGYTVTLAGLCDSAFREVVPVRFAEVEQAGDWTLVRALGLPLRHLAGNMVAPTRPGLWGAYYQNRPVVPVQYDSLACTCRLITGNYNKTAPCVLSAYQRDAGARRFRWGASADSGNFRVRFFGAGRELRLRPAPHQPAHYLGHNLFMLRQHQHWHLLDSTGRPVLPLAFESIGWPAAGRLVVQAGGRFGVIDTLGRFVLPLTAGYTAMRALYHTYHAPYWASDSLLLVQRDSLEGVATCSGRVWVPLLFPPATPDSVAYTFYPTGEFTGRTRAGCLLYGRAGKVLADFRPALPRTARTGQLRWAASQRLVLTWPGGLALFDEGGRQLSPNGLCQIDAFENGVAWASEDGLNWAVMDLNGKLLTPFRYTRHEPFYDGIAQTATAEQPVVWVDCFGHEYRE